MEWHGVSIPQGLYDKAKRIVESHPELGYATASAFVADAIRRRLEDLGAA